MSKLDQNVSEHNESRPESFKRLSSLPPLAYVSIVALTAIALVVIAWIIADSRGSTEMGIDINEGIRVVHEDRDTTSE